ncbi:ATPase, partial [Streptococcus agalactiae]|nr:ATPase [Streptococcus agalactiae]
MLIEMWSPAFKKEGEIREPIKFHLGLNVVMGMDNADNSIGKSSTLLAIDFIFGGTSYLKSVAVKKVGDHPIYF